MKTTYAASLIVFLGALFCQTCSCVAQTNLSSEPTGEVVLTVTADGTRPFHYYWYKACKEATDDGLKYKSSKLTISPGDQDAAGSYIATVRKDKKWITLGNRFRIKRDPNDPKKIVGQSFHTKDKAVIDLIPQVPSGDIELIIAEPGTDQYQWYKQFKVTEDQDPKLPKTQKELPQQLTILAKEFHPPEEKYLANVGNSAGWVTTSDIIVVYLEDGKLKAKVIE